MNPRDETDMDGDDRLISAMRELCKVPTFSIGDEIAKWNAGARIADDRFCPCCGARGYVGRCPGCQREVNESARFHWGE